MAMTTAWRMATSHGNRLRIDVEFQKGDDNDDVEAHRSHHQGGCERRGLRLFSPAPRR